MAIWAFVRTFPARRLKLDFIPSDMRWREKSVIEGSFRISNPTPSTVTITDLELIGPAGQPCDITLEKANNPETYKTRSDAMTLTLAVPAGESVDVACTIIFADKLPETFKVAFGCTNVKGTFRQELTIRPPIPNAQNAA